jgi:hypothetical protein
MAKQKLIIEENMSNIGNSVSTRHSGLRIPYKMTAEFSPSDIEDVGAGVVDGIVLNESNISLLVKCNDYIYFISSDKYGNFESLKAARTILMEKI